MRITEKILHLFVSDRAYIGFIFEFANKKSKKKLIFPEPHVAICPAVITKPNGKTTAVEIILKRDLKNHLANLQTIANINKTKSKIANDIEVAAERVRDCAMDSKYRGDKNELNRRKSEYVRIEKVQSENNKYVEAIGKQYGKGVQICNAIKTRIKISLKTKNADEKKKIMQAVISPEIKDVMLIFDVKITDEWLFEDELIV